MCTARKGICLLRGHIAGPGDRSKTPSSTAKGVPVACTPLFHFLADLDCRYLFTGMEIVRHPNFGGCRDRYFGYRRIVYTFRPMVELHSGPMGRRRRFAVWLDVVWRRGCHDHDWLRRTTCVLYQQGRLTECVRSCKLGTMSNALAMRRCTPASGARAHEPGNKVCHFLVHDAEFVIQGCETTELFRIGKGVFNKMSGFVHSCIVLWHDVPDFARRYDGFDILGFQHFTDFPAVIGFVRENLAGCLGNAVEEGWQFLYLGDSP